MFSLSDQAGTPAAPTPPRLHPRRSAGEKKSRRPRGEIGSSVKVADPRRKVAKSFDIVAKVVKVVQSSES